EERSMRVAGRWCEDAVRLGVDLGDPGAAASSAFGPAIQRRCRACAKEPALSLDGRAGRRAPHRQLGGRSRAVLAAGQARPAFVTPASLTEHEPGSLVGEYRTVGRDA